MSRDDLIRTNQGIVTQVTQEIVKRSPNAILICVTNPLDAMAQLALKVSGFPRQRVMGQAGVLDTARFRTFIAQELNVSVRDVQAFVLGGHGDTMVPLARLSTVAGVPLPKLISADRLDARSSSALATAAPRSSTCSNRAAPTTLLPPPSPDD